MWTDTGEKLGESCADMNKRQSKAAHLTPLPKRKERRRNVATLQHVPQKSIQ